MEEKCGVVGVVVSPDNESSPDVAHQMYYALYALQHRGQESTGIAVYDGTTIHSIKGMGLVPEVYIKDDLDNLSGNVGIGHVRYSTTGDSRIENCQPFVVNYKNGCIALAHNGNLINGQELRDELESEGHIFVTESDTEVIVHLLVKTTQI